MSNPHDDERWLDVLAGKVEPRTADERMAARARSYFDKEDREAQSVDPSLRLRVENMLMARLAEDARRSAAPARHPGPWRALMAWLVPAEGGHSGRYAAVAAAVMAVVAVPLLMRPGTPAIDDPGTIKSPGSLIAPEAVIASPQPAQDAERLLQALASQGVVAALSEDGADRVVVARVPADRLTATAAVLQRDLGLTLAADGQLRVRFKASAP